MSQDGATPDPIIEIPDTLATPEPLIPPASREPLVVLLLGVVLFAGLLVMLWMKQDDGHGAGAVQESITARSMTYLIELARYHTARGTLPASFGKELLADLPGETAEHWLSVSRDSDDARSRGLAALNAAVLYGEGERLPKAREALASAITHDAARAAQYRALLPLYASQPHAVTLDTETHALLKQVSSGPLVHARVAKLDGRPGDIPAALAAGARAGMRLLTVNLGLLVVVLLLGIVGIILLAVRSQALNETLTNATTESVEDVPWGPGTALIIISLAFLLANLLGGALLARLRHAFADAELVAALASTLFGVLLAVGLFLLLQGRAPWDWRLLGWRRVKHGFWSGLLLILPMLPLILLITVVSQGLLGNREETNPLIPELLTARNPWLMVAMAMAATVVAPITEETLFRGILFRALHARLPFWSAALVSGVLFALMHRQVAAIVPITFLGMIFALMTRRTHSVLASVGAHAGYNGFITGVLLLTSWALRGPGG